MLFTHPGDELSCQKLISPPDLVQISSQGYVKSNPQDDILNIKLGRKRHAGEESSSVFFMWLLLIISCSYHSKIFEKHQHSLVPRPENQMAYLCADCTLSTHRCRDACGTIEARLLLQPESCLSGKRDLGNKKPSVRS